MKRQMKSRKEIAKQRIRGFLILLIVIFSFVLFYDIYLFIESRF